MLQRPKQWTRNGMRQILNSQHKLFNQQTSMICDGNSIGKTMFGSYVRGKLTTECNGFTNPPGHLRDFDLKPFIQGLHIPRAVLDKVLEVTETRGDEDSVILYALFHYIPGSERPRKRVMHGWILTENDRHGHKLIQKWYSRFTGKTISVVETCLPFLAEV